MNGVCFGGDVMLSRGLTQTISQNGNEYVFQSIGHVLKEYEYRFINLECPLTSVSNPVEKQFSFRADTTSINVLRFGSITHASLANNHAFDQHFAGTVDTYTRLAGNNIIPFGFNPGERKACLPVEVLINNNKVAVFGASGLELSAEESQHLCSCNSPGLTGLITTYQRQNPGAFIVCYLHWGIEYSEFAASDQEVIARKLIDAGADMIVGHHPHVVQSITYYKGKPVFYSLGNLVFDQHRHGTREGIMAGLDVADGKPRIKVIPYRIENNRPVEMDKGEREEFKKHLLSISKDVSLMDTDGGWALAEENEAQATSSTAAAFPALQLFSANFSGIASLEKLSNLAGYRLQVYNSVTKNTNDLHVKYPVYRFDTADVDMDGKTDILLGVIKSTHFDPVLKNRLFIIRVDEGRPRPLWLGSKVCLNLVDFRPVKGGRQARIKTLEKDNEGNYLTGYYRWDNFGLVLEEYTERNMDYLTALTHFYYDEN